MVWNIVLLLTLSGFQLSLLLQVETFLKWKVTLLVSTNEGHEVLAKLAFIHTSMDT